MKRILIAALLVLIMSVGSFAAAVTISGEAEYGVSKTGDADAAWYSYPGLKLKFANDNFELRFRGQEVITSVMDTTNGKEIDISDPDWDSCWIEHHDCVEDFLAHHHDLFVTTQFGVKIDRLNVKLPVAGAGTFVAGRQYFGTGDWDALGRTYDGLGWSGTFDKLTLKALWDVKNEKAGGRAALAFGKLTVGGNYVKEVAEGEEAKSCSVDARLDFSDKFDLYGEYGDDDGDDIRALAAEAKLGGFDFYLGRDFEAEETELYTEKTVNNVLLHAGYVKTDDEDGTLELFARYTF